MICSYLHYLHNVVRAYIVIQNATFECKNLQDLEPKLMLVNQLSRQKLPAGDACRVII